MFTADKIFGQILLKAVPVICVIVMKQFITRIASRVIFLNRKSTILAIDNFRAFNIFLYFNFFFDCFMGVVSAIIRLVKSVVLNIVMMPSILGHFLTGFNSLLKAAKIIYSLLK
jgi:hypothetical protein